MPGAINKSAVVVAFGIYITPFFLPHAFLQMLAYKLSELPPKKSLRADTQTPKDFICLHSFLDLPEISGDQSFDACLSTCL